MSRERTRPRRKPPSPGAELPTVELSEEGERLLEEALEDVRAGRVTVHDSVESLLAELHAVDQD